MRQGRREALALLAPSLGLSYLASTFWARLEELGGLASIERAADTYPSWIAANPWPFHATLEDNMACVAWGVVAGLIPWCAYMLHLQKRGNYDPGKEHGDARWASDEELSGIVDHALPSNNFMYTQKCGLVRDARDGELAKRTSGKNKNACTVGSSGAGKSARMMKPRVMASLGTALYPGGKNPAGLVDEGFDILLTDPKGDAIYDLGHALVNAGRDVKPFNTIFPNLSLHYNPLHYIETRRVDAVKPEATAWGVRVWIDGEAAPMRMARCKTFNDVSMAGLNGIDWLGQPKMDRYSMRHAPAPEPWVCPECAAINGAGAVVCTSFDCAGRRPSEFPDDVRVSVDPVLAQKRERAGEDELAAVSDAALKIETAAGMPSVRDVCAGTEYVRSTIAYGVCVENRGRGRRHVSLEFALDKHEALSEVSGAGAPGGERYDAEGRRLVTLSFELAPGEAAEAKIVCRIRRMVVPDGISLTKTANCLVNNLAMKSDNANDDPFWDNAFRLLLMGLIAYLFEVYDEKYRSLRWVMYLLNRAKVDATGSAVSPLDQMFDTWETGTVFAGPECSDDPFALAGEPAWVLCDAQDLEPLELDDDGTPLSVEGWAGPHDPDNDIALNCYKAFAQGAPETKQSILITAQTAFANLLNEDMRELLDYDEMHLETIGDAGQAQAIFLIGSDTDKTFAFLHALMMYQVINLTCDKALKKYRGSLPRHFRIIADEFANTGRLPDIDVTIAVVRSRNISIEIFLQSVQQLSRVYGDDAAEVIKDNCSTYVFLGGQSEKTLEGLEKMSGTETVDMWQLSKSYGQQSSTSENRQAVQRNLVTMAQLRQLPDDEAIVQMSGMPPVKDKKINFGGYDFYEWIDPTRAGRGQSKGRRKFEEPFDVERYLGNVRAGEAPYDLRPDLIAPPARWERG